MDDVTTAGGRAAGEGSASGGSAAGGPVDGLAALDALPEDSARAALASCLDAPGWIDALVAGRPWPDAGTLLAEAGRLARELPPEEIARSLARHPRIGERPTGATEDDARSRREQSGVTAGEAAAFAEANRAYERRFGHIYLVCAAGRTGAELLADCERRMSNPPDRELLVVREELARIADLRLRDLLAPAAPDDAGGADDGGAPASGAPAPGTEEDLG